MKVPPTVSVCMITYGHENYISQAIEGVLMQQCDFEIELIIANDCSPDNTDAVVKDMIDNHPNGNWIRYIKHERNLGMVPNFLNTLHQAKGKYIALCEGDDYWTDPLKLQKQLTFLINNPSYCIHSEKAQVLKDGFLGEVIGNPLYKANYELNDFFTQNNLISCTVLFKNTKLDKSWFTDLIFCDWMLYVQLLFKQKKCKAFISENVSAVYRLHEGGVMQTVATEQKHYQTQLKQIKAICWHVNPKYTEKQVAKVNIYCYELFKLCYTNSNYRGAWSAFISSVFLLKFETPFRKYLSFVKNFKT